MSADAIVIPDKTKSFDGKLLVLAMEPNSLIEYIEDNDIVICGDRKDIQEVAINSNISLMIVTGNGRLDEKLISLAKKKRYNYYIYAS